MQPDTQSPGLPGRDGLAHAALDANTRQYITFTLGREEYGIDIMVVREIKGWTDSTMIPNAPAHVRGVINLRGIIVPIFDLRARFGLGRTEPTAMNVVIIVAEETRTVGLLVDAVSDIIAVDPQGIRPVPDIGASETGFLEGLVAIEERMVTLVSLAGLFETAAAASPSDQVPATVGQAA